MSGVSPRRTALAAMLVLGCRASAPATPATDAPAAPPRERLTSAALLRRLGLPDTARLVILHGDDAGMTPRSTARTMRALAAGQLSSASYVAIGAAIDSVRAALRELPAGVPPDLGIHLAITSETPAMRFRAASARAAVRTLVDREGFLLLREPRRTDEAQIERELAAQVARARAAGLPVTHLDSHQGALLYHGAARFAALRRVAKAACLPIPVPESFFARFPYLADALDDGQPPLADLMSIDPERPPADWERAYDELFATMRPGVTLLLVHVGEDTPEERALFHDHREYDAAWRARDDAIVSSGRMRAMAADHGVQLTTWSELTRVAPVCATVP